MVGGIIFLLPVMVMQSGIIFSVAVLAIFSFISSHTFKILTLNCQPQEFDFQDITERIMGPTWKKILNIVIYCTRIDDIVAYWDNSYIYNFSPGQLLGSVLLGYQIQSTSVPVMKFNKNQQKNERDINITFLLAFCLYLVIGLLGGLSLLSLGEGSIEGKETIIDFFGGQNITPILIELLYLVHLFSVYPIFWHLTKSRGYEVFIGTNSKPPKWLDPAETEEDELQQYLALPEIKNFNGQKLGPMLETLSPTKASKITSNSTNQHRESLPLSNLTVMDFYDIKKINSKWLLNLRKKNKKLSKLNFSELEQPKKGMMNIIRQQIQQAEDEKWRQQQKKAQLEQEFQEKQRLSESLQQSLQLKHNRYLYEKMSQNNKNSTNLYYQEQNSLLKTNAFFKETVNNGNNNGNDSGKLKYKKSKNFGQIKQEQNKKWGRNYQLLPPENAYNLNTIFIDEEIYNLSPAESQQNYSQQPGWWYSISSYNQSNYKPISREGGALIQNGQDAYLYGGISSDVFKDVEHLQINKFGNKLISWKKLEIQNDDRNQSPQFLSGHTINFYNGNLVVFGGEKKLNLANPKYKEVQNDVWLLNLQKKIWQKQEIKSAQIHPRRHHTACIMGKYLVIYGGLDKKQEFLSDISYYNFEKSTWKNLKLARQMPPVAYHTCQAVFHPFRKNQTIKFQQLNDLKLKPFHDIVYEGLYFFGGIDQNNQINGTLKVIEPDQQPLSWTEPNTQGLAPSPRYCHQMVFNDKLNILAIHGGKNDQNLVSEYYLNDTYILQLYNMNWIKIQDFGEKPIPRFNGQMGFFDSKLFIFGGLNGEGYCNSNVQILELDKQIIAEQYLTTTKIKNKQKKLDDKIFNHQNHYYESLVDKREIELQIQKAQEEINNLMHPNQIKMKQLSLRQIFLEKKFQNLKNQYYNKKNLKYTLQPIKTFMQLDLQYIENAQEKQFYEHFPELKEKILKGEYVNEDEFLNTFYQKKSDLLKEKQKIFLEKKIRSKTLDSGIYFPRDSAPPKSLKQPVNKLMTLKLKTLQNHQNLSNFDQNQIKQEENFKTPKTKIINALSQQQQEEQFQQNKNIINNNNKNNQIFSENQIYLNYQQSDQKNNVAFNQTVLSFPLQNTTRTQLLQEKLMLEKRASKNKDKQKYTLDFKQTKEPNNLTEAKVVSFRKQNLDEKQQNMLKDELNGKINIQDEELVKNLD
ncbi:hypothetical protein PPERSA_11061 [Pseudocohnilembus persalinus]|uniref:Amino acid transporter transmembrane domain-containing protein n=1 Tax=Pseudocohnilembus persalinus TaxID=266149 RepID=A0A0V0R035_PSEPJ|nr:hypothetical protein PPERSA_11061 [Pseudocohnilembus persalinus]|eukprot:KRX07512.1 hypothetical protein PPERSA_11061 [Pseudocohnilembus persalinus]